MDDWGSFKTKLTLRFPAAVSRALNRRQPHVDAPSSLPTQTLQAVFVASSSE
jgi:hypothetical protein